MFIEAKEGGGGAYRSDSIRPHSTASANRKPSIVPMLFLISSEYTSKLGILQ
jgi:hypothetical protein